MRSDSSTELTKSSPHSNSPEKRQLLPCNTFQLSNFFRLYTGLQHNDCLYEDKDVQEAIRRLPRKLYDERNYRITRALHLSMTKTILPKNEWTKYEEDVKYLEPYLDEVIREREEREDWSKNQ